MASLRRSQGRWCLSMCSRPGEAENEPQGCRFHLQGISELEGWHSQFVKAWEQWLPQVSLYVHEQPETLVNSFLKKSNLLLISTGQTLILIDWEDSWKFFQHILKTKPVLFHFVIYCRVSQEPIYGPQDPLLESCDTSETNTRSTCNKFYKWKNIFCHEKSEELPKSNYDTGKVKLFNGTPCPQIKNRQFGFNWCSKYFCKQWTPASIFYESDLGLA